MKRLLITGLLGLTLINHVHAGSLAQAIPKTPTEVIVYTATGLIPLGISLVTAFLLKKPNQEFKDVISNEKFKNVSAVLAGISALGSIRGINSEPMTPKTLALGGSFLVSTTLLTLGIVMK